MRGLVRLLWLTVAWTAVVWVGRIRNVVGDDELTAGARTWRLIVAIAFLVLAALVATLPLGLWHRRPLGSTRLVAVFCLWTIVFWTVRGGGLLFADHDVGFKMVHTALALASIGLAGALHRVDREVARAAAGRSAGEGSSARLAGDLAMGVDR
ncbi:MAG: hypothetical protein VX857_01955 [Actinomycetota bacterium]|nr:hypothetical protein [Actinomycetota bacterium]MED5395001.1 hypothetical protein [Actinomycetota bacterium]MEE3353282.1 hypothetical protein [Actinomycetota bacterium]